MRRRSNPILSKRWEPGSGSRRRGLTPTGRPNPRGGTTGGVVLDPFLGSGSTLRAAKELGHPAIGIEIEGTYCGKAAARMAQDVLPFGRHSRDVNDS